MNTYKLAYRMYTDQEEILERISCHNGNHIQNAPYYQDCNGILTGVISEPANRSLHHFSRSLLRHCRSCWKSHKTQGTG